MTDDRGSQDLTFLIEQHKKEIWEWKQKESKWLEDKVLLDGTKKLVDKLSEELTRVKKRAQEAEGEVTLVKGIGMNSPEMRSAQARIKELELINNSHQELNGKLQGELTEIKEDNKKLAHQVEDKVNIMRNSGL
jgi:hypothetical protein|tara:strand:- start:664 stop:1065 length:402 start_codon:yes stop_codon:yes gene_type:complete